MHEEYFEAVLQLRNVSEEIVRDVVDRAGDELAWAEEVENGVDVYMQDQNRAKRLAHELRDLYGGDVAISSSLYTIDSQSSEKVYRLTATVRFPDIAPGDHIVVDDRLYRVEGLGKDVKVWDVAHEKETRIDYPDRFERKEEHATRVVQNQPSLAVLHPESYQQVRVENPDNRAVQEKVTVVEHHGLWLV